LTLFDLILYHIVLCFPRGVELKLVVSEHLRSVK